MCYRFRPFNKSNSETSGGKVTRKHHNPPGEKAVKNRTTADEQPVIADTATAVQKQQYNGFSKPTHRPVRHAHKTLNEKTSSHSPSTAASLASFISRDVRYAFGSSYVASAFTRVSYDPCHKHEDRRSPSHNIIMGPNIL